MERSMIIKALECHANGCKCSQCPMSKRTKEGYSCWTELSQTTLSLIKELTEENDRLSTALAEYEHKTNIRVSEEYVPYDDYEQLREEYKKLTEECERLQQTIARVKKYCQTLKIRIPPMSVVTYIEQIEKEFLEAKE